MKRFSSIVKKIIIHIIELAKNDLIIESKIRIFVVNSMSKSGIN